jgi:hypothetical protein
MRILGFLVAVLMAVDSSFAFQVITVEQANTFTGTSDITESDIKLEAGNWSSATLLKLKTATKGNNRLVKVDMGDAVFYQKSNFASMFEDCRQLAAVVMPVSAINSSSFSATFNGCVSLSGTVDLSSATATGTFSSAFRDCAMLESVKLPLSPITAAVSFNYAFSGCQSLEKISNFSSFTNINGMASCFNACSNLTEVDIPNAANVNNLSNTFANCTALKKVVLSGILPASKTNSFANANNIDCTLYVPLTGWEEVEFAQSWGNQLIVKGGGVTIVYTDNPYCIEIHSNGENAVVANTGGKNIRIFNADESVVFEGISTANQWKFPE